MTALVVFFVLPLVFVLGTWFGCYVQRLRIRDLECEVRWLRLREQQTIQQCDAALYGFIEREVNQASDRDDGWWRRGEPPPWESDN